MSTHNWRRIVGISLIVGLLALAGLATVVAAQGPMSSWQGWGHGGMMGGWDRGGWGDMTDGFGRGFWNGMMNGGNRGGWSDMMNGWGGMMGGGMMGGYGDMDPQDCHGGWGDPGDGTPLTLDEATSKVEEYVKSLDNDDLVVTEVMEFENNFYAEVEEESTGIHAFELLVHRYTGAVMPEPGPNMMWNTKYGHMAGWGGMMGGWQGSQGGGEMTVTSEQALAYAQKWLDSNLPGTTAADEADAFYGYYTIHTLEDGEVTGMLSVNGYSGAVWYHSWHGEFQGMEAFDH